VSRLRPRGLNSTASSLSVFLSKAAPLELLVFLSGESSRFSCVKEQKRDDQGRERAARAASLVLRGRRRWQGHVVAVVVLRPGPAGTWRDLAMPRRRPVEGQREAGSS